MADHRPALRRLLFAALALPLAAAAGVLLPVPSGPAASRCAWAAGDHHAAVMVEHSSGALVTACVAFTGAAIGGAELMAQSGIEYQTGYGGRAVCQIDYEPSPPPAGCFSNGGPFWALFYRRAGGPWMLSSGKGVTDLSLGDGDAIGWRYDSQVNGCPDRGACPAPPLPSACPPPAPAPPPAPPGTAPPAPAGAGPTADAAAPSPAADSGVSPAAGAGTTEPAAGGPAPPPSPASASPSSPASFPGHTPAPRPPAGPSLPGLLAALAAGGLAGLFAVQLARRR